MANEDSGMNEESNPIEVWLVEDNVHFRKTVDSLISSSPGMTCSFAVGSCEEAIEKLGESVPPQVILLDVGLPGMSGVAGIERIKQLSPSTYIIMLTVQDSSDTLFDAFCAGASGYLLKDSSPEKIVESIREVLAGGAPMNMTIARKVLGFFNQFKASKADYGLTEREKNILQYVLEGLTKQQIADKIFVSYHTVNTHLKNIYSKLQVHTRSGAVAKVLKEKLL